MDNKQFKRLMRKVAGNVGLSGIFGACNNLRYLYRRPYRKILTVLPVAGQGLFVHGWLLDPTQETQRVEIQLASGRTIDITADLVWVSDEKLLHRFGMHGLPLNPVFAAWLQLPRVMQEFPAGSFLRFVSKRGRFQQLPLVPSQVKSTSALDTVKLALNTVPKDCSNKHLCYDQTYGPLLQAVWKSRELTSLNPDILEFNPALALAHPVATLIIPLQERYDLIEYQLCEFVNDGSMRRHEILYVIDDPNITEEVAQFATELSRIYKIAFKIVLLSKSTGNSAATNAAAKVANGQLLLLMKPDVMPSSHGWLDQLIDSAGESLHQSITGVRLLCEDKNVRHNGLAFFSSLSENHHLTKQYSGQDLLSDHVSCADGLHQVEVVSGACLLMSRDQFYRLDGLDENYILGDFHEVDLCLKARRLGMRIQVNSGISLYHLDRISQSSESGCHWRQELSYYNSWRLKRKWNSDIVALNEDSFTTVDSPTVGRVVNA